MSSGAEILKLGAYLLLYVLKQNLFTIFQKFFAVFVKTVKFGSILLSRTLDHCYGKSLLLEACPPKLSSSIHNQVSYLVQNV